MPSILPSLAISIVALLVVGSWSPLTLFPSSPQSSSSMSLSPSQRALAAVTGAFVADAASMGLHWVYDAQKMAQLAAARPQPEFYDPPSCPFYSVESGAFSPYGDEVLPLLQHVATHGGLDAAQFATDSYKAAKASTGYLNGVFKQLVAKVEDGKTYPELASPSKDLHGGIKAPVLAARYWNDAPLLLQKTREATKVHEIGQEPEDAAVAIALLLQQVVRGVAVPDAIKSLASNDEVGEDTRISVQQVLDAVAEKTFKDANAAIEHFGKACPLPGSLQGALYVLLTSNGYVEAVRVNMLAGGDNCSRAMVIGAVAAAAEGGAAIPDDWKQKTKVYAEVQSLAEKLVQ